MLLWRRSLALTARRTMATSSGGGGAPVQAARAAAVAAGAGRPRAAPPAALDRDAFRHVITVPALRIPKRRCAELMKAFRE
jgi:hypothetical protein